MLQLRQLHEERCKAGEACKDSKRIMASKRSKSKQIRLAVGERACWLQLDGEAAAGPAEAAIKVMIEGGEPLAVMPHKLSLHEAVAKVTVPLYGKWCCLMGVRKRLSAMCN